MTLRDKADSVPGDAAEGSRGVARRSLLLAGAVAPALLACAPSRSAVRPVPVSPTLVHRLERAREQLGRLEAGYSGRIGVYALDTGSGTELAYRAAERFAMCSTFKMLAVAAILRRHQTDPALLARLVRYDRSALVANSPVTAQHLADGMPVSTLCAAAIAHSDNTAANLLLTILGGPNAVTAFARTLGDRVTRLDRWEPELNVVPPGDQRDTSTPAAMGTDLRALALGSGLDEAGRALLLGWLLANTTGATRIRAGLPADWRIGDKTGAGARSEINDVAIAWPPNRAPVILSIYTARIDPAAPPENHVVAEAATIAARGLGLIP
jgi:beta-lactamase class A